MNPTRTLKRVLACAALCASTAGFADIVITSEIPMATNPSPYIVQFLDEVAKRTNGELKGKYFAASQLYNDRDAIGAIGTGAVHMVWPVTSRLEQVDPRIGVASLPFMLSSREMTNACFAKGFTQQISSYIEPKGMRVLGLLRTADLMFLMKSRDVQRPEDLKGQKVRVVGGQIMLDAMRTVQASPISMSASEMSAALAQGAIDGVMSSPAGWVDVLGATAKHGISVPGMALATSAVVVDKSWFDKLPEAHRKAVQSVLDEIIARQWKETAAKDEEVIKKMVRQGASQRVMRGEAVKRLKQRFDAASQKFRDQHSEVVQKRDALEKQCMPAAS